MRRAAVLHIYSKLKKGANTMKIINAIIRRTQLDTIRDRYVFRIVLIREDGSREELPGDMSLTTAKSVQKLFRNM